MVCSRITRTTIVRGGTFAAPRNVPRGWKAASVQQPWAGARSQRSPQNRQQQRLEIWGFIALTFARHSTDRNWWQEEMSVGNLPLHHRSLSTRAQSLRKMTHTVHTLTHAKETLPVKVPEGHLPRSGRTSRSPARSLGASWFQGSPGGHSG